MSKYVDSLFEIISLPEFRDLVDSSGRVVVPSSALYKRVSEKLNGVLKPKYIYTILKNNRYGLLGKLLDYHNISVIPQESSYVDSILSSNSADKTKSFDFKIKISPKIWEEIQPEVVFYSDRKNLEKNYSILSKKIWSDKIFDLIYQETKLPCAISFKRSKVSPTGIYVSVSGSCPECNCSFTGLVINKPIPHTTVEMECSIVNFDASIIHSKKRQLKGKRREEVSEAMVSGKILPCLWRRKEADRLMEFGEKEPPSLPTTSVLRKAKQERCDINLDIKSSDPFKNIDSMIFQQHAGEIHLKCEIPFFVHYWTLEQMAVYLQFPNLLSIDATGSLVKKIKKPNGELCSHIYLYQIVAETPSSKMPVFQMLSSAQNTSVISFWLNEIVRRGSLHKPKFPLPREVVCDFDKALLGAISRIFGECKNLQHYLNKCFKAHKKNNPKNLPSTFIRLDISHFIHMVSRWKEFRSINPRVKSFYILVMGLLSKTQDFPVFEEIVRSAVILCCSQECGTDSTGRLTKSEMSIIFLREKIKGTTDLDSFSKFQEDEDEILIAEEEENSTEFNSSTYEYSTISWANEIINSSLSEISNSFSGCNINPYYLPNLISRIKKLIPYFPLFSGILIPIFGYGKATATSSAVESEFNDIKHRLLKDDCRPMRVDKFITKHLKSFSGRAKLAFVPVDINKESPIVKSENLCCPLSPVHEENKISRITDDLVSPLKSSVGSFESEKLDVPEIALEQNWRGKNSPKAKKRTYLDPRPYWNLFEMSKKNKINVGILLNGNLCPIISNKTEKIVVRNTCGFDSIVHILAYACCNDVFYEVIKGAKTKGFQFVNSFMKMGPGIGIYRLRADLLKDVDCFIQKDKQSNILLIDATSNVLNLCEWIFKEISYSETSECLTCNSKKTIERSLLPINIDVIKKYGFGKVNEALREGRPLQTLCRSCGNPLNTLTDYKPQLFIECSDFKMEPSTLSSIQDVLELGSMKYQLAGIVVYHGSRRSTAVGHYTALIKSSAESWLEIDDLLKKPKKISGSISIIPEMLVYIKS